MSELSRSISSETSFDAGDHLLDRLKEGDEEAFSEVFHLYRDMIYTLAMKLLTDKGESMDLTQDVFVRLFRKVDSFRGDCSLKTWLYRVTINEILNRNRWWRRCFRRRSVSLDLPLDDPHSFEIHGNNHSPARSCFSSELQKALGRELEELPLEQKIVVTLRDIEGLTYEEIAEITGTPVGTVKSRIARGRDRLRERLEEYRGGDSL